MASTVADRCVWYGVIYTPGKKFLQKFSKLIFHSVRHWVASWTNCQYDVYIPGNMSGKNEWNWPYSLWIIKLKPTQLWPPQMSTFCDQSVWPRRGKSTISQRWQVIGMKAAGPAVSHIAQTMQMSLRTVYSMLRRHRENPGDVKDRPRSGRRCATTAAAGTFHEDAYYTTYYTLSSTIKIGNVIK